MLYYLIYIVYIYVALTPYIEMIMILDLIFEDIILMTSIILLAIAGLVWFLVSIANKIEHMNIKKIKKKIGFDIDDI